MKENNWLMPFAKNIYSQFGEDGITEKIFEIIGEGSKWCVDIGAWDGKKISNTYNLMNRCGWSGVFVEADFKKFPDLLKTYEKSKKATCLNRRVDFKGQDSLDSILKETSVPKNFDFFSLDIDGNDYHAWDAMRKYSPRVALIEFNRNIHHDIDFIQPRDMKINQGSSLLAIYRLGKKKGYELVAATDPNAFFVKKEYFSLFNMNPIEEKDLEKFIPKRNLIKLYQLFDGTIVSAGNDVLAEFNVKLNFGKASPLPRFFKMFPPAMGPIRSFLFRAWRKFYNKIS